MSQTCYTITCIQQAKAWKRSRSERKRERERERKKGRKKERQLKSSSLIELSEVDEARAGEAKAEMWLE